tara:strand:- start:640 stop:1542 length:903 start_codon:yes stop_codon:yes gene_type:complete
MAKNDITLGDNQPLSNDLKPIKVGGEASIINVSSPTPDDSIKGKVLINGDLTVTGKTNGKTITEAGDISQVSFGAGSDTKSFTSGDTLLMINGGSGIDSTYTTASDTIVISAVDASTTTAGKVELATTAETTTGTDATRAVTPDGLKDSGYMGFEFIQLIHGGFNYGSTGGTKVYLPLTGYIFERTSQFASNEFLSYVAPYDGYLNQVVVRSEQACLTSTVGFHKSSTNTEHPNGTASESVEVEMAADDTSYKFAFTGGMSATTNTFSAGDIINLSFTPESDANDTVFTAEFILDRSSGL